MNDMQKVYLIGGFLGLLAGFGFGFTAGAESVLHDKTRNSWIQLTGWLDGYKDCLNGMKTHGKEK